MTKLRTFFEKQSTEYIVAALVVINAIILGLETSNSVMSQIGSILLFADKLLLGIFVLELIGRMIAYQSKFFKDGWRIFDLVIISIALLPDGGALAVLRALRVLRVLRLITLLPSLKRVVGAMVAALPGMGSVMVLLCLLFYVASVMATKLYGEHFPEWFGTIGASAYSLFQIMTLESWSMGIVRPVMEIYPYAWAFFVVFILFSSFLVINLLIGIIVGAMQEEHDATRQQKKQEDAKKAIDKQDFDLLQNEIIALRKEVSSLRDALSSQKHSS